MKRLFSIQILIIMMFFTSISVSAQYDMSVPVEGESIANDVLQFNVVKELYKKLSVLNPVCYNFSIKNTQLIHYPYDVKKKNNKYISGYWKELWTVDICGSNLQFPITFYINDKAADFKIDENSPLY